MEYIEFNKLSHLHDGKNIIFCKTDFLKNEFDFINKLDKNVILITGNSDYPIDEKRFCDIPKNVSKWYAINALVYDDRLIPIPLGLENKLFSDREGHGIGYFERSTCKEKLLKRNLDIVPTKEIYSNFVVSTNYTHRSVVRELCIKNNHIDWEEPNLNLVDFFDKILEYKMIVCPAGNGVDTHRLWEVLYSHRVPIVIKTGNYKIYELYEKLPIIILNDIHELNNHDILVKKYNEIQNNKYDLKLLSMDYWENKILNK